MKKGYLLTVLLIFSTSIFGQGNNMLVNSKDMATELAEIYIKNVYGNDVALNQKPYQIFEEKDVWVINGKPPKALGGNFHIVISKKNGQVEKITHSK